VEIGFLVFPGVTQLDLTGPQEVLSRIRGAITHLIWKTLDPLRSSSGLWLTPTSTYDGSPRLDVLCVPGGPGIDALLTDRQTLRFVRQSARHARYVTSVCTGSLLLAAAGLLNGRRASSHWNALELLTQFGATPEGARIVEDGKFITAGGVTAGIDFAFWLVERTEGRQYAQEVQLELQYDPQPPFRAGTPETAPAEVLQAVRARHEERLQRRRAITKQMDSPPES
jgi:cyclohexyl-isocyanide hydratase